MHGWVITKESLSDTRGPITLIICIYCKNLKVLGEKKKSPETTYRLRIYPKKEYVNEAEQLISTIGSCIVSIR